MAMNGVLTKVKKILNVFYVQQSPCGHYCNVVKCWKWTVSEFLEKHQGRYAVIILNRMITQNHETIKNMWNNATFRMTVDGGTVHWDTFVNSLSEIDQQTMKIPDLITGDFDSITKDVLQKYKNKGCKTVHTPDQEHTDFTKAMIELNNYCEEHRTMMSDVIAIAQSSGRIDQILGNIQTLHLVNDNRLLHPKTRVYIMSEDALSWLLQPGDHIIDIPLEIRGHREAWCSLVPVGEVCEYVTTSGLKWNLDNQQLKFGKLVSTSNTFDGSEQVKIKCSHTLLWSMKIPMLSTIDSGEVNASQ